MPGVPLKALYSHMEWADALVWQTVLADSRVSRDDYVVDSLFHSHMVQRAWLAIWRAEEVSIPTRDDFAGLAEIRDWARSYHPEAASFLAGLTEDDLRREISVPWTEFIEKEIGGPASPACLGDTVYQVAAHSSHHRAQIQGRVREVGGSPQMVDYIGWIWRGRPAADWAE